MKTALKYCGQKWLRSVGFFLFMLAGGAALAQTPYPNRPIRFVLGFAPAGPTDILARVLSKRLSEVLGQPIIIDNRPGADSLIATKAVAQSVPDGYTLLIASGSHAINPSLYPEDKTDPVKEFSAIGIIGDSPNFLVVNAAVPVRSVTELIDMARKNPGKLNYASTASTTHLQTELFNSMAGIDIVSIPYKGFGPAVPALLSNEVQIAVSSVVSLLPHVKSGKLIALAVTSAKRSSLAPDVPTVTEKGLPGYVASTWYGMLAPANTPVAIVRQLNSTLNRVMAEPEVRTQLLNLGLEPMPTTPDEFTRFIQEDRDKWAKLMAGLKKPAI